MKPIQIPTRLHLVVVDLHAAKDTTEILQDLQDSYPTAKSELDKNVQHLFGEFNLDITQRAIEAMVQGNPKELGKLYVQAQAEFDKFAGAKCPNQLTAPVLHKVLQDPDIAPYIYGGKGIGSQGDGTAQFLCKDEASQANVRRVLSEKYVQHACMYACIHACGRSVFLYHCGNVAIWQLCCPICVSSTIHGRLFAVATLSVQIP